MSVLIAGSVGAFCGTYVLCYTFGEFGFGVRLSRRISEKLYYLGLVAIPPMVTSAATYLFTKMTIDLVVPSVSGFINRLN